MRQLQNASEEWQIIADFLLSLEANDIPYVIVGDRNSLLPRPIGDIDIVVPNDALHRIEDQIRFFFEPRGGKLVQRIDHEQSARYFVVWIEAMAGRTFCLKLDICSAFIRRGQPFLTAKWLIQDRQNCALADDIRVWFAADEREFIYYLIKKIDKGHFSDTATRHLADIFSKTPLACRAALSDLLPEPDVDELETIMKQGNTDGLNAICCRFRQSLRSRVAPPGFGQRLAEQKRRMARIFHPTGVTVGILGPDGAGKSTLLDHLTERVAPLGRLIAVHHLRPATSSRRPKLPAAPVDNPHLLPPRSLPGSVVKLIYLATLYYAGWMRSVWYQRRASAIILFDRYFHDVLADPFRYRDGSPKCVIRLIGKAIPKPDVWFILDAPPEIVRARKTEVSWEESERQLHAYRALARELPNAYLIDATQSPENVANECERRIVGFMSARLRKRSKR